MRSGLRSSLSLFLSLTLLLILMSNNNLESEEVDKIVINEISYNLKEDRSLEEWIELYNPNDETIDLNGWTITDRDKHKYRFRNIKMQPHSYLIFFTNEDRTRDKFEKREGAIYLSYRTKSDKLLTRQIWNNTGDEILLLDAQGRVVDYVEFGEPNDDIYEDAIWSGPNPSSDLEETLALIPNGDDRDSGSNWEARAREGITMGYSNDLE